MNYGVYKNARNAAWQCIIDHKINTLPVKVSAIASANNISIIKNSQVNLLNDNKSGSTIIQDNKFYIVYRDTDSICRCRFTIAHELGHFFLGHLILDNTFEINTQSEHEANVFARALLAPACVLHELHALEPEQIALLCNISMESATYRSERMKILEERNAFYLHPLERRVRDQFEDFINKQMDSPANDF